MATVIDVIIVIIANRMIICTIDTVIAHHRIVIDMIDVHRMGTNLHPCVMVMVIRETSDQEWHILPHVVLTIIIFMTIVDLQHRHILLTLPHIMKEGEMIIVVVHQEEGMILIRLVGNADFQLVQTIR